MSQAAVPVAAGRPQNGLAAIPGSLWTRLAAPSLFPAARPVRSPMLDRVLTALLVLGGPLLVITRQVGPSPLQSLWAEDGAVFFGQASTLSTTSSITTPYAGYGHLLPRLVALIATVTPVQDAALVIGLCSAVAVACLAAVLFRSLAGFIPSSLLRLGCALFVLAPPLGKFELIDVLANLQWFLVPVCFWVLLWRPASSGGATVAGLVGLFAFGSSTLVVFVIPIALLRLATLPRREQTVLVGCLLGGIYQAAVSVGASRPPTPLKPSVIALVETYGTRTYLGLFGPGNASRLYTHLGWGVAVVAVVVVLLALLPAAAGPRRPLVLWTLGLGAANVCFALTYSWTLGVQPTSRTANLLPGLRYDIFADALLGIMVVIALNDAFSRAATESAGRRVSPPLVRRGTQALLVVIVAGVGLGVAADFRGGQIRNSGALWATSLAKAEKTCSAGAVRDVTLATTPLGWAATIPCSIVPRATR